MTTEQLLALKDKIERGKTKLSELKGQKTQQLETLLEEWDCKSVEEAETKLTKLEKELETLEIEIEEDVVELKEKYPDLF